MNQVSLVGRLTKNAEMRYTPNGIAVTSFYLAVNRPYKNQEGEHETDFIRVITWRKLAENVAQYCGKGSLVSVEGRIQTRRYSTNDRNMYVTEVVASQIGFLDTKPIRLIAQDEEPNNSNEIMEVSDENLPF